MFFLPLPYSQNSFQRAQFLTARVEGVRHKLPCLFFLTAKSLVKKIR